MCFIFGRSNVLELLVFLVKLVEEERVSRQQAEEGR